MVLWLLLLEGPRNLLGKFEYIIPTKPELRPFWRNPLTKPPLDPFGLRLAEIASNCSEYMTKTWLAKLTQQLSHRRLARESFKPVEGKKNRPSIFPIRKCLMCKLKLPHRTWGSPAEPLHCFPSDNCHTSYPWSRPVLEANGFTDRRYRYIFRHLKRSSGPNGHRKPLLWN